ncbi:MAG: hypothetical protein ABI782_05980 [Anaerolineaceae bacterium]
MEIIVVALLGLVICSAAAATAAVLYAISLRATIVGLEAHIVELEAEREERAAAIPTAYQLLETEWGRLKSRWHRHGEPFALALIDLGDALRPDVDLPAAVMTNALAGIDQVRRAEDYEFQLDARTVAVLLAGSSTEGGWAFVDRLRRVLGNKPFSHEAGAAYVDVRVGVAEWSMNLNGLSDLVDAAQYARTDFNGQIREQRADFQPGLRGSASGR